MTRMVSGMISEVLLSTHSWKSNNNRIVLQRVEIQYFQVDACLCALLLISSFPLSFLGFVKKFRREWKFIISKFQMLAKRKSVYGKIFFHIYIY